MCSDLTPIPSRRQIIEYLMQQPHELTPQIQGDLGILKYTQSHPYLSEPLRHLKGVIYEVATMKCLACGFVIPDDLNNLSVEEFNEFLTHFSRRLVFTEIVEGVQFRVYYYRGQWKISTMGMLNPILGFEGRKSFRNLFLETFLSIGLTFEMLNPSRLYLFTLQHPDEPMTVDFLQPRLYLMDVLDEEFEPVRPREKTFEKLYPYSLSMDFDTSADLLEQLKNVLKYEHFDARGFICEFVEYPYRRLRVETDSYRQLRELKGNCPTPELRYLQLWIEGQGKEKDFESTFPRYERRLKSVEKRLKCLINWITQKRLRHGRGSLHGTQLRDQLVTLQESLQNVPAYLRGMGFIQLNDLLTTVN